MEKRSVSDDGSSRTRLLPLPTDLRRTKSKANRRRRLLRAVRIERHHLDERASRPG